MFGDNDTLSSMVATMVEADLLILLGEVDGLFTSDPNIDPDAELIQEVTHIDQTIFAAGGPSISNLGRGGMTTKIEAAKLSVAAGVNMVISSGLTKDVIIRLVNGEQIGTLFHALTIACGISNYSSSDLAKIAGMKSDQFEMILDVNFGDEIVHRDNMVILVGVENGI